MLAIYNLLGLKIRSLVDNEHDARAHAIRLGGKDDIGTWVTSGLYLYAMSAGEFGQGKNGAGPITLSNPSES